MIVRIYFKRNWYETPPSFIDVEGCDSVKNAEIMFRQAEPKLEFVSAKRVDT